VSPPVLLKPKSVGKEQVKRPEGEKVGGEKRELEMTDEEETGKGFRQT
jgi:hypothetical protein